MGVSIAGYPGAVGLHWQASIGLSLLFHVHQQESLTLSEEVDEGVSESKGARTGIRSSVGMVLFF